MKIFTRLWLILVISLFLIGSVIVFAQPEGEKALLYLPVPTSETLAAWQPEGIEVYARLNGRYGPYFIAGADETTQVDLTRDSIEYQLLDADTAGDTYFWAAPTRGRSVTLWEEYGRVLLFDGFQYLLRTTPQQANQLSQLGVEVAQLTLTPQRQVNIPAVIPPDVNYDPVIQTILQQIASRNVRRINGNLSGEWNVTIGGEPHIIASRYTYNSTQIQKATQYAGEYFQQLGLEVEYHQWGGSNYPNVIAEIPGNTNPEQVVIICAHLDSMPPGELAPGADDNGSGSTGVLIAATILSQYDWDVTLRFALWTGEEQGLLGSDAYAVRASNASEQIVGVLNMDMIAYNSDQYPILDLHARSWLPESVNLANLFVDVVSEYSLALQPQVFINDWLGDYSDNKSFWDVGYPAILVIEDDDDFTPFYHTTGDQLSTLNLEYFTTMIKASVGTFAHLAGSPWWGTVNGQVTSASDNYNPAAAIADAQLDFDSTQHSFSFYSDSSGFYTATLPAGVYTLTVTAENYLSASIPGIEVSDDVTITSNIPLQPANDIGTLQGFVTAVNNNTPIPGATITLWQNMVPQSVVTTSLSGYYHTELPAGVYTLTATAVQYYTYTLPISITSGMVLTQNIALEPAALLIYLPFIQQNTMEQPAYQRSRWLNDPRR